MIRWLVVIYCLIGTICGLVGLACFVLTVGEWRWSPFRLSTNEPTDVGEALIVNAALVLLFAIQHSGMARRSFKRVWGSATPLPLERVTYVAVSGIALSAICFWWSPLPGFVWNVTQPVAWLALCIAQGCGWLLTAGATMQTGAFAMFGVEQSADYFQGRKPQSASFTDSGLYRFVRHPLQLGLLIGIWVGPTMSLGHLLLAILMTGYILAAIQFEEADLIRTFGKRYQNYQKRTPMLLPIPKLKPDDK